MIYPNKKEQANNKPYHLTAIAPRRNISGLTSQGMIRICMIGQFTLLPKVENILIDNNH
jgi:hypothetical protein